MSLRDQQIPTNRRLHVLHVSAPTRGGVATVVTRYVRDQVERGWNVTVACPSRGDLGYAAREAGAAVRWWRADPHDSTLPGAVARLRRIVSETKPDVVHLHSGKAGLAGRLVVRDRIPTVFQPHAWAFLAHRSGVRSASLRWERYAARWATELVCVSTTERQLGESLGIHAPTTVVLNGVDLAEFRPAGPRDRIHARKLLGLDDVPTVLCVGELVVQKGQQDLITDWPAIRARVPGAELLFLGDGADRLALERLAEGLDGVTFVGSRTDVPLWMAAADVVVVPSRWDGMALVPLEAMACARSVVATDVNGVVESVPPDAGAVVPLDDPALLVEAVVERLENPTLAEEEGWRGRSHVESQHDATTSARELARVYLRLVGARRGR
ncbi:glycosyltransferase family 4 protein [Nocardioides halotolerans]|uniref:glycosyltransferase family 4 protein n=1 Tax=Nocardioides halotolerans TaxID=433660 RepID=UPI000687388C|nr:glycosyltransferase family 4 protein [Nocardioides halotolerans]